MKDQKTGRIPLARFQHRFNIVIKPSVDTIELDVVQSRNEPAKPTAPAVRVDRVDL